jgi:hypothetical protein
MLVKFQVVVGSLRSTNNGAYYAPGDYRRPQFSLATLLGWNRSFHDIGRPYILCALHVRLPLCIQEPSLAAYLLRRTVIGVCFGERK